MAADGENNGGTGEAGDNASRDTGRGVADEPGGGPETERLSGLQLRRSLLNLNIVSESAPEGVCDLLRDLVAMRFLPTMREFVAAKEAVVWGLAVFIGIGVGYAAIAFRGVIGVLHTLWLQIDVTSEKVASAAAEAPWIVVLLVPVLGGLVVGQILDRFMPGRRAHGVADVIEARAVRNCKIPAREGFLSALVSALSLGAGASAGREGPIVHLGATLASLAEDRFSLPASARRVLLACGVGAAVSASFNAPMAGVLFAHEVILAHFAMSAFVPIVIASVVGTVLVRVHLGDTPAFSIPDYEITSFLEFPAFALLGVTCALVSIIFQSSLIVTERVAWSFRLPLWARPAIGGFAVGLIALAFPEVLGVGYEATDNALHQRYGIAFLFALLAAKTAATAITLASRFGGGIFSPSLYLGAMTGGAYGLIAAAVFPAVASSDGLYAILGMAAVAAAVLGAPISTAVIVFELTGGYAMAIAILLTVSIATGLTRAVHGESYFHWQLSTRGLFLHEGPHMEVMRRLAVRDFMISVEAHGADGAPDPLDPDDERPWLLATDSVEAALRIFDRSGHHRLAVVESRDTTCVVGWADHLAALNAFNQALIDSHVEEHR